MSVKSKSVATRKLRLEVQSYHESQGTSDNPKTVILLEELKGQEQELEKRLEAMLSFPFPLVTSVAEYNDLLPDTLGTHSELDWVRWLRSHLRPNGEEWDFDNEILEQIKDGSLRWDAIQMKNEFAKLLEIRDAHLGSQQKGEQGTDTGLNILKPLDPDSVAKLITRKGLNKVKALCTDLEQHGLVVEGTTDSLGATSLKVP